MFLQPGSRDCVMCRTCSKHAKQQEAMASMLSTQARVLDALQKNVLDIQRTLESLKRGLEERGLETVDEKLPLPVRIQQRRKSLPMRMLPDEVYVQLAAKRHEAAVLSGALSDADCNSTDRTDQKEPKMAAVSIAEQDRGHHPSDQSVVSKVVSEKKVPPPLVPNAKEDRGQQPPDLSLVKVVSEKKVAPPLMPNAKQDRGQQPPDLSLVKVVSEKKVEPAIPTVVHPSVTVLKKAVVESDGRAVVAVTKVESAVASSSLAVDKAGAKPQSTTAPPGSVESKPPPDTIRASPQQQEPPVGAGKQTTVAAKTDLGQRSVALHWETSLNVLQPLTKSADSNQHTSPARQLSSAPEPAAKVFPPPVKAEKAPCPEKAAATSVKDNVKLSVQFTINPIQPTICDKPFQKPSPKVSVPPSSLAPPKPTEVAVPPPTTDHTSMRHVQSCPEALQRLQSLRPKVDTLANKVPWMPKGSPPATAVGTAFSPAVGQASASGIQIRVSPATEEKTTAATSRAPPKTVLKVIDDIPPQPAPFSHRFVALKTTPPHDYFTVHTKEVLGGGRFGKVHRCTENSTGLRLAAKIIVTRTIKEKEMAGNEIQVMNQLSHANVLQLYAAFELKNQVMLILEYVEGGELFERIVDESSPLTEVDAMVFVRQICEGIQYMHQMYVLHLDLKPENILCVNRTSHQVKIIDFGLARRYKPREKLRVSFGTPEFLAPEIVNFDFVSFPTDMWTLGVITYMLLSGLSPFLGDDDTQTLNNVVMVSWYFDEDAFEHVSDEARDFISNLLIKERSGRYSAAQCLKHSWLNNISEKAKSCNIVLKSQVLLKKYMARRMWKKNYIAIAAANRFKKIGSSGSLTSLAV
ncbi:myosin light chain kinase 2, skeletal/cardiac muscle [Engraulis encrasicolus]|uniref:myosin light chain kinase 2, skeletal/cardiac muscle n=1 Tax=Engraulis encrasicolus TaxID=184585 RepID=UPI002FD1913F